MPSLKRTEQLMFDQMLKDLDAYYDDPANRHLLTERERNYKNLRDLFKTIMPLEEAERHAGWAIDDFYRMKQKTCFYTFKYYDSEPVSVTLRKE